MRANECLLVMAVWLVWLAYWIASSGNSKAAVKRESERSRRMQSIPLVVGGILVLCPDVGLPILDARYVPSAFPVVDAIGVVALVVGLAFTVFARIALADNWSVSVTLKADHDLISTGPYAWVRHPIYSGALLATLGSSLVGGEYRGLLGFGLIAASLAYKVNLEERWLSERFGSSYRTYQSRVAALLPLVY